MRRTPIAHVIFPRPNAVRPVPEFAWGAVQALAGTSDLDIDVLMPLPVRPMRRIHSIFRKARGAWGWPEDIEETLLELDPKPTLVPYLPLPKRSTESVVASIATIMLRRSSGGRPKVLHGSFLDEGGFVSAMVARVIGCPSIVVAHGTDVRAARGQLEDANGRRRRALGALRSADRVVAVSCHLANEIALLGTRADVLQFTAAAEDFPLSRVPEGPPEILFVGRIGRAKGVDLLLEAFARLERQDSVLTLVGPLDGDLDADAECARLGISSRVQAVGELANTELPAMYAKSTCVALPSRWEGLGNVLVESLLVGRPVVAADVGGIREVVDDRVGRLVAPEDVGVLARAIDDVLRISDRRGFEPEVLRARALPLTWEVIGPRLASLTRDLFDGA